MATPEQIADERQLSLIAINTRATNRSLRAWRSIDYAALDDSWARIEPTLVAAATGAQLASARGADGFTSAISKTYEFDAEPSRIVPRAFAGVDGSGRDVASLLHGAVTTTKESVGVGLSRAQSLEAGANYLAVMMKTLVADMGRSADMVSSAGKGYTRYVRVVEPGACSRCVVLAGADRFKPFQRHPACKCTCQPVPSADGIDIPHSRTPEGVFEAMSEFDQDRAFGKAGAQAIRDGANPAKVQSARRGSNYLDPANRMPTGRQWNRMQKTTIGHRPDGTPVQVYSTTEGTTARGEFYKQQSKTTATQRLAGARYKSTSRVRLMPESILEIAGEDESLRKAFLRDAGYLEYRPTATSTITELRVADRKTVNKATIRFGNFTLG